MQDKFQKELRRKWELLREAQARYVQNVPLMDFLKKAGFQNAGEGQYVKQTGPNTIVITPYSYTDQNDARLTIKYGDDVIWDQEYQNVKDLINKVNQTFSMPVEATLEEAVAYLSE